MLLKRTFSGRCSSYDWSRHPSVAMNCKVLEGEIPKPVVIVHGMLGSSTNWLSLARIMQKRTHRTGRFVG